MNQAAHTGTKVIIALTCACIAIAVIVITHAARPHPDLDVVNMLHDVEAHRYTSNRIIDYIVNGKGKGMTYRDLAYFVDRFGPRPAGSKILEDSIDFLLKTMNEEGLDNVHGEEAMVPHWVRGNESLTLLTPRRRKLSLLGGGGSVGTPPEGITADVIVVHSFEELQGRSNKEISGKIVLYNMEFETYGKTVKYRYNGAAEAAKKGAVAAILRSITPFSINSPHAGWMNYQEGVPKIPSACITVEVAAMLDRMYQRGNKIRVNLKMEAQTLPPVKSRNVIAEVKGWKYPEQVVVISGHIDSWDVGQGAMDDGAGAFIGFEALKAVKALGLRPKRTLRAIGWTAEEVGMVGAHKYYADHTKEAESMSFVAESDIGTFTPFGIKFKGSDKARVVMQALMRPLDAIDAGRLGNDPDGGDVAQFEAAGVPNAALWDDSVTFGFTTRREEGIAGAIQYFKAHHDNISNFNLVAESDGGTFKPRGLQITGSKKAEKVLKAVLELLEPIGANEFHEGGDGEDVIPFMLSGVPSANLYNGEEKYWWYHHSEGDYVTVLDPHELDLSTTVWAVLGYVTADMECMLPRNNAQ